MRVGVLPVSSTSRCHCMLPARGCKRCKGDHMDIMMRPHYILLCCNGTQTSISWLVEGANVCYILAMGYHRDSSTFCWASTLCHFCRREQKRMASLNRFFMSLNTSVRWSKQCIDVFFEWLTFIPSQSVHFKKSFPSLLMVIFNTCKDVFHRCRCILKILHPVLACRHMYVM